MDIASDEHRLAEHREDLALCQAMIAAIEADIASTERRTPHPQNRRCPNRRVRGPNRPHHPSCLGLEHAALALRQQGQHLRRQVQVVLEAGVLMSEGTGRS